MIAGLLPGTQRRYERWGPPRLSQPIVFGQQLLALCRYRYDWGLGRHSLIAGNLFLDGFDVDLEDVRYAMEWAQLALATEARRVEASAPDRRSAVANALAADPTAVAAMVGLDQTERAIVLYELATRGRGDPLRGFVGRAVQRSTGADSRLAKDASGFFGRIPSAKLHAALSADDAELVEARNLAISHPELMAGLGEIRSPKRRAARRLQLFTSLVAWLPAWRQFLQTYGLAIDE